MIKEPLVSITCRSVVIGVILSLGSLAQADDIWPWAKDSKQDVSVLIMGDTNIKYRKDHKAAYQALLPTFKNADIIFANLEGPFAGSSKDPRIKDIPHKTWAHSEPDQVQTLVNAGFDIVGVANNVTYPWQALMRSLAVLDDAGIAHVGGGKDIEAAHTPTILNRKGVRIGFMQYAATVFPYNHAAADGRPGIAAIKVHTAYQPPRQLDKPGQPPKVITWLDETSKARMIDDIRTLRKKADVVIVSYHWGISGSNEPVSYQSDIGQTVIDAGADLVVGHGPHKYQPIEYYKGRLILHSLAQGVFDDRKKNRRARHREGLLARALISNRQLTRVSLVPTWRDDDDIVRLKDPNRGKGLELYHYLKAINLHPQAAELAIKGSEIILIDGTK